MPVDPPVAGERIFIGMGANLGDPVAQLLQALAALRGLSINGSGWRLMGVSSLYRTAPWQAEGPDFLNAVVAMEVQAEPLAVLHRLQSIEAQAGRERPYPNAPRTLDLDLLLHGKQQLQTPELTVPHPRARERAFVCAPLLELAPDLSWPGTGERLAMPRDHQVIHRLEEPRWPRCLPSDRCGPAAS